MRAVALWSSLVFGSALWVCTTAVAAGLGPMTVRSMLGQPLIADIELVIRDKRELEGLKVNIASIEAHRKADIPYTATALGLKTSMQTSKDGRSFIRVESAKPVTEPAVKLLIELIGPGAQALRVYNALFEPPEVQRK